MPQQAMTTEAEQSAAERADDGAAKRAVGRAEERNTERAAERSAETPAPSAVRGNTWTRDHLANERTLLAWLRTALAFMAFGLATAKLGMLLGLYAEEYPHLAASLPSPPVSRFVGAALIAAGAVLAVLGARRTRHWSTEVAGSPPRSGALSIALGITLVTGIGLMLYILL